MKRSNIEIKIMTVSTGVLILFFGIVAPTYTQQERHEQNTKRPNQLQQDMPKKQQQQAESRQWQWEQRLANSWQKQQQNDRPSQNGQRIHQGEQRGVWQQHRAHSWQNEHHNWHERGGYNGYHIPENHFHDYFGRDHRFRIHNLPLVIFNGYPCFQYEGYWFGLVDPWPENWSYDWFENDDVYIEYSDDGYYLYNRRHPDIGIAISVFMN